MVSPKQLAVAIGVSESSLKRWADDGQLAFVRTAGGHRRIPLAEAVRFVRHMGLKVKAPGELGLAQAEAPVVNTTDHQAVAEQFFTALEAGDASTARGLIQSLFLGGWTVAAITDGPIRAALARIGILWQHAEWGIVVEHRSTDLCLQTLQHLRSMLPPRRENAPTALGGAGEHDPYMIPSLAAAVALAEVGFNEVNLGPLTPPRILANAIAHYRPQVVWYSLSHVPDVRKLEPGLAQISAACAQVSAGLIIGGASAAGLTPAQAPGATIARSMSELVAFARGRCSAVLTPEALPNG
jgi:excisionase family DNA binding protein